MADSCRTSRKGRTLLSRGSLAKTSARSGAAEVNTIRICYDARRSGGRRYPGPPSPLAESAPGSGRESAKNLAFQSGRVSRPLISRLPWPKPGLLL